MNKSEFIACVAQTASLSKKDAEAAVNAVIDTITGVMKSGDSLQLVGFGTFKTVKRAEKKGKNPRTGEQITVPATIVPKFKAGSALKEAAASSGKKAKKKK